MTDQLPDSHEKRDPARITHYMLPNKSLIPIDGYLIPERTWVVIRDAIQRGSWGDWEEWINEEVDHPDVPSISELRSALSRAGLKEQAIRDLVLLAVVVRDRVYREVHDNLTMDELPTGFEPLNVQSVNSLMDIVDQIDTDDYEVEFEYDDDDSLFDDDDFFEDDPSSPQMPTRFGPWSPGEELRGTNRFSRFSAFNSGNDGNESPSRFGASNSDDEHPPFRFGVSRPTDSANRTPGGTLLSRFGGGGYPFRSQTDAHAQETASATRETHNRLDIMGVEQSNIKQILFIMVMVNLMTFATMIILMARMT